MASLASLLWVTVRGSSVIASVVSSTAGIWQLQFQRVCRSHFYSPCWPSLTAHSCACICFFVFQKLENYAPVCCTDCSTFTMFTALMLLITKSAHVLSANLTHQSEADGGKQASAIQMLYVEQNFKWNRFKVLKVQLYCMCARNSVNMCL